MPRTELFPISTPQPVPEGLTFEDVRMSFLVRLHGEEKRLTALQDALESAEGGRVPAIVDLQIFAHRLRGAAAVFGLPEIRDAAKNLEMSCAAAATSNATLGESLVQDTIRMLSARLTFLNGFTADSSDRTMPSPVD